jgi:hypothetical protein
MTTEKALVALRAVEEKQVAVDGALTENILLQEGSLPCNSSSARIQKTLRRICPGG